MYNKPHIKVKIKFIMKNQINWESIIEFFKINLLKIEVYYIDLYKLNLFFIF